jgi:hypothetical protein
LIIVAGTDLALRQDLKMLDRMFNSRCSGGAEARPRPR